MTYIFDEEPMRWTNLLERLGLSEKDVYGGAAGSM